MHCLPCTNYHARTGTIPSLPPFTGGVVDLSHNYFHGPLPTFTRAPLQYSFDYNCQLTSSATNPLTPIVYPFNRTSYTTEQQTEMAENVVFQLGYQGQNCHTGQPTPFPTPQPTYLLPPWPILSPEQGQIGYGATYTTLRFVHGLTFQSRPYCGDYAGPLVCTYIHTYLPI